MNYKPKVLISILNWNNADDTILCVESVLYQNYSNFEIVLIDNASNNDSVSVLKNKFPSILLIKSDTNFGYAGGHKLILDYCFDNNFDLLWILNNDALVDKNTLNAIVSEYNKNKNAIFGSCIVDSDRETIKFCGGYDISDNVILRKKGYNYLSGIKITKIENHAREVSDISGASMLLPVDIIKKYGFIDTTFFLYAEETDFCYKLRRKYNVKSYIVPQSQIIHKGAKSFDISNKLQLVRIYYIARNTIIFKRRHIRFALLFRFWEFIYSVFKIVLFYNKTTLDDQKKYYRYLGKIHGFVGIKGKTIDPSLFI